MSTLGLAPRWLWAFVVAMAANFVAHTRWHQNWMLYELATVAVGLGLVAGMVVWILHAMEKDRPGTALMLVGAIAGLVAAYVGAGSSVLPTVATLSAVFGLPVTLIFAGFTSLMTRKGPVRMFLSGAGALLLLLAGVVASDGVRQHDILAARHWCEALVPNIDAFEQANGHWPVDIEGDGLASSWRPRLLRGETFYRVDPAHGAEFVLTTRARQDWITWREVRWQWSTSRREWRWWLTAP